MGINQLIQLEDFQVLHLKNIFLLRCKVGAEKVQKHTSLSLLLLDL